MVKDQRNARVRAADVDVKESTVREFDLARGGHVVNVSTLTRRERRESSKILVEEFATTTLSSPATGTDSPVVVDAWNYVTTYTVEERKFRRREDSHDRPTSSLYSFA